MINRNFYGMFKIIFKCIVNIEKILICILSYLYLIFLLKIISYKIKKLKNNF